MQWEILSYRNIPWEELEAEQNRLIAEVQARPELGYLLMAEPTATYTHGRNAEPLELKWDPSTLLQKHITVAKVTRGGKWTYHGPGQLIVYPIVHLPALGYHTKAARAFVETLRLAVLDCLCELGIRNAQEGEPFGVYLEGKKLVSFGLNFEKGIASNGLALYYSPQAAFFEGIVPCGVQGGQSTSLAEYLKPLPSWEMVAESMTRHIKNRFSLGLSQVV